MPQTQTPTPDPLSFDTFLSEHRSRAKQKLGISTPGKEFGASRPTHTHEGIDIPGSEGESVESPFDATVIFAGNKKGYGNVVYLQHPDGTTSRYAHLKGFQVEQGDKIKKGVPIGFLGMTGNAKGPHVHYERRDSLGDPIDPLNQDFFPSIAGRAFQYTPPGESVPESTPQQAGEAEDDLSFESFLKSTKQQEKPKEDKWRIPMALPPNIIQMQLPEGGATYDFAGLRKPLQEGKSVRTMVRIKPSMTARDIYFDGYLHALLGTSKLAPEDAENAAGFLADRAMKRSGGQIFHAGSDKPIDINEVLKQPETSFSIDHPEDIEYLRKIYETDIIRATPEGRTPEEQKEFMRLSESRGGITNLPIVKPAVEGIGSFISQTEQQIANVADRINQGAELFGLKDEKGENLLSSMSNALHRRARLVGEAVEESASVDDNEFNKTIRAASNTALTLGRLRGLGAISKGHPLVTDALTSLPVDASMADALNHIGQALLLEKGMHYTAPSGRLRNLAIWTAIPFIQERLVNPEGDVADAARHSVHFGLLAALGGQKRLKSGEKVTVDNLPEYWQERYGEELMAAEPYRRDTRIFNPDIGEQISGKGSLDGKTVVSKDSQGRVIIANEENKTGVSKLKTKEPDQEQTERLAEVLGTTPDKVADALKDLKKEVDSTLERKTIERVAKETAKKEKKAKQKKEVKKDAETVRSDEGQVQAAGDVRPESEVRSSEEVRRERQEQAGAQPESQTTSPQVISVRTEKGEYIKKGDVWYSTERNAMGNPIKITNKPTINALEYLLQKQEADRLIDFMGQPTSPEEVAKIRERVELEGPGEQKPLSPILEGTQEISLPLPQLLRVEHDTSRSGGVRLYLGAGEHIPLKKIHEMLDLPEGVIPDILRASDEIGGSSEVTITLNENGKRSLDREQELIQKLATKTALPTESTQPSVPTSPEKGRLEEIGEGVGQPSVRVSSISRPENTPKYSELTSREKELADEFNDWANYSHEDINKVWGMKVEDPEAKRENQLSNLIDEFAKSRGISFDEANNQLLYIKPESTEAETSFQAFQQATEQQQQQPTELKVGKLKKSSDFAYDGQWIVPINDVPYSIYRDTNTGYWRIASEHLYKTDKKGWDAVANDIYADILSTETKKAAIEKLKDWVIEGKIQPAPADPVKAAIESEKGVREEWVPRSTEDRPTIPTRAQVEDLLELHQRITSNPVRSEGMQTSSEARIRGYFAQLAQAVERYMPEQKELYDEARTSWRNGDLADATVKSEQLLTKLHSKIPSVVDDSPSSATYGSRNKLVTRESKDKAVQDLKDFLDPNKLHDITDLGRALPPLVKLGAYHIEAGAKEFKEWAKAFAASLTPEQFDLVGNHLRDLYAASKQHLDSLYGPPAVEKITKLIKEAAKSRRLTEKAYSEERSKRIDRFDQTLFKGYGEEGALSALGQLKGELPKSAFEPIREQISTHEADALYAMIANNKELGRWEKAKAVNGLRSLLNPDVTVAPATSELNALQKVYGKEFVKAVMDMRSRGQIFWDEFLSFTNIPRTILASFDLSAPFRQGVILTVSHPIVASRAFKATIKAFGSETYADQVMRSITSSPMAEVREQAGLYQSHWGAIGDDAAAKEEFYSVAGKSGELLHNIDRWLENTFSIGAGKDNYRLGYKGIAASERAYLVYLNKLRADVFDNVAAAHPHASIEELQAVAEFINYATGRGSLGRAEKLAPLLNNLFFSPRFAVSRFQSAYLGARGLAAMGREVLSRDKTETHTFFKKQGNELIPVETTTIQPGYKASIAQKMAARDFVKFVGAGTSFLGLLAAAGMDVGWNPTSSDFGKIKVGNTRVDIWGGMQQPARYAAQLMMGGRTPLTTTGYQQVPREEIFWRFLRSKESPQFSFIHDLYLSRKKKDPNTGELLGTDFIGRPVTTGQAIRARVFPLAHKDIYEAIQEDRRLGGSGVTGGLLGSLGIFGFGITTIPPKNVEYDPFGDFATWATRQ